MTSRFNHKIRDNQDSRLDERKVNLRNVLYFTIGLFSPFSMIVNEFKVYPIEIIFAIYVILNSRAIVKIDSNLSFSRIFFLFIVILIGIALSSIRNDVSTNNLIAEISNVIFFLFDIAFLYIAIMRHAFSYLIIGCLSGTVFFNLFLNQQRFDTFWKFNAVTLVFLIIMYLRFRKLSKLQSLFVTGLTIFALITSVLNDSRIFAALFATHLSLRFIEGKVSLGKSAWPTIFIVIFSLLIFYNLYVFLVTNGYMGQAAYIRYASGVANPLGPIIGARVNNLITLQYLFESPLWGHGAYAPIQIGSHFNSDLLAYSEQESLVFVNSYTPHSLILRFWYSGGLISLIAAVSIYLSYFKMIILTIKNNWSRNLPLIVLITTAFLFNPISGFSRVTLASLLSIAFYAFVKQSQLNIHQKSQN